MMRIIIVSLLTFLSNFSFGQLAIILDKDGYVNVRTEIGGKISDTLHNGHFVFCFETKDNWTKIDYSKKKNEPDGYVHRDRLKLISEYENIPVLTKQIDALTFSKDSIEVIVTEQKFDKTKYRFSYFKDAQNQIQFINGKQYWGTDGEQPRTEYKSISIILGNRKITLPKAAIEDLFEPSVHNTQVNYDRKNDILYIQSMNSDGAGSYYVVWRIKKGVYKDRYIAYGF